MILMASESKKKTNKKKGVKLKLLKTKPKKIAGSKINKAGKSGRHWINSRCEIGVIGNFGSTITFAVNADKLLTFSDFNRTVSGKWMVHDAIGKRGKTEFVGPDLSNNTMTVILDASHGINPRKMINAIEKAVHKGTAEYLVIGGKKVGTKKLRITQMSEEWEEIYNNGFLYRAVLNLTFDDYVK